MSESLEVPGAEGASGHEPVTVEDLQRMLDEANNRNKNLEQERDSYKTRARNLEGELDGERVARTVAEEQHAARAKSDAERRWDAQKEAIKNGVQLQEGNLKAAKADYSRFAAEGDWDQAAEAQERMAQSAAELTSLRSQDRYLDSNKEQLVAPPRAATPPAPARRTDDPYASVIGGNIHQAEREWLDQRPQFLSDPDYREQVFAASNLAAKRFPRGAPAYIKEMNRLMGEETEEPPSTRQNGGRDPAAGREPPARSMSGDLPPQRRAGPGQEPTQGVVRAKLTQDQAEVADALFGDPNKPEMYIADPGARYGRYAERLRQLRDAGRLD